MFMISAPLPNDHPQYSDSKRRRQLAQNSEYETAYALVQAFLLGLMGGVWYDWRQPEAQRSGEVIARLTLSLSGRSPQNCRSRLRGSALQLRRLPKPLGSELPNPEP